MEVGGGDGEGWGVTLPVFKAGVRLCLCSLSLSVRHFIKLANALVSSLGKWEMKQAPHRLAWGRESSPLCWAFCSVLLVLFGNHFQDSNSSAVECHLIHKYITFCSVNRRVQARGEQTMASPMFL